MRFRTQLRQVKVLIALLNVMKGPTRGEAVLKLSERRLLLIGGGGQSGVLQVLCTLKTSQVMESIRIESQMNNEIYLKIDIPSMLRVLKPAERAKDVTMKLAVCRETRKPVLQFCMAVKATSTNHDIIQEIPVAVLVEEEVSDLIIPDCSGVGPETASVYLPNLAEMKPFVEKVCKISDRVTLVATTNQHSGVLELRTQTMLYSSATQWRNLLVCKPDPAAHPNNGTQAPQTATCTVDARRFNSVLQVDQVNPPHVLAHLVPGKYLIVQAAGAEELSVVFIVPCITS
eukprot:TRINITY_DN20224_c0_g1_i1.p1 TRINITY_DN20224_c0_g1~~TRINITY_DN20224_c0_g1_i1.p1  ORF type:complete len:287 (+),score=89.56 TRINITY_DN20224_c0_g1_i1:87-947(+)